MIKNGKYFDTCTLCNRKNVPIHLGYGLCYGCI